MCAKGRLCYKYDDDDDDDEDEEGTVVASGAGDDPGRLGNCSVTCET